MVDNEAQVKAVKEANPEAAVVKQVKVMAKAKERAKEKAIPIHRAKAEKVKVKVKERERVNPTPMATVKAKVKAKVNPMVKAVMLTKKAKIVPNPFPINSKKR